MKQFYDYNREAAVAYAKKWALGRNPAYKDYELLGGDCTNYISQSLHAGGIPFDHNGEEYKKKYCVYIITCFSAEINTALY